jgi:hypothetical protein
MVDGSVADSGSVLGNKWSKFWETPQQLIQPSMTRISLAIMKDKSD